MSSELMTQAETGLGIFDSGQFEQMGMIAAKMANTSLLPETLRGNKVAGKLIPFEPEVVAANCFRVVEQAQRWGMSPFAIMDGASVIHGKLMWEGKVIAAAIETNAGVRLSYAFSGEGQNRKIIVSGKFPNETETRTIEGTVKDWKTDQWKASDYDQRLVYRGARQWGRRHSPGIILGVYAPDEFNEGELRDVTPSEPVTEIAPFAKKGTKAISTDNTVAEKVAPTSSEPESEKIRVKINAVDIATGNRANGQPWTRYRVSMSDGKNELTTATFSKTVGELAQNLTGHVALVQLQNEEKGVLLKAIEADQPVASTQEGGIA